MRPLSKREEAFLSLFKFADADYAILQLTQTALDKGYTDATIAFREFLKRTGIHDFDLQEAGIEFIKYLDVFGLCANGTELLKISFQRPATKGGRMYRVSKLGGLKNSLNIQTGDTLIFSVCDNQLQIANLTNIADRTINSQPSARGAKPNKGAVVLDIAKKRIIHVMESMPECEASTGTGAKAGEIGELTGMLLTKKRGAVVNALLEELCFENQIQLVSNIQKRYRLCP